MLHIIKPHDVLVTFDIKSGFHHIPISQPRRKYLGVEWRGRFDQWNRLPFAPDCSSYHFYKTLRPVA